MHALKRSSFWVASALCLLTGLFLASGILPFLSPSPAYAAGEKYTWIRGNNIRAEGGDYFTAASLDKDAGNDYEGNYAGGISIKNWLNNGGPDRCNYHMTVDVDDNNAGKARITYLERNADPGHSGCPTGQSLKDRWGGAIAIGKVPEGVPGHTPSGNAPIPDGCPGSPNPKTPPPAICNDIPPGCPGSPIVGPPADPNKCPYDGDPDANSPPKKEEEEKVQCTADSSFSWILCPILDATIKGSKIISSAIDGLLYVSPLSTSGSGAVMYNVWDNLRNFANVLFILVMFAIIFSQATSMGISAYGVKRILPKLVAAAIMANLSYFICAIAVDIFNVLGQGIGDLVASAATAPVGAVEGATEEGGVQGALASIFSNSVVQGIVATVGIVVILLSPLWATIVIVLLVALLTLAARQALIIILVLLAPVAFAAWVMPNTEKYFKKWFEMFLTALLMYPLIMIVFAGSRVAASVLSGIETGSDLDQNLRQTIAIFVAIVPLIALPTLFKVGSYTLGRVTQMANKTAGAKLKGFDADIRQRAKGRLARPYNPTLNKDEFDMSTKSGRKQYRSARRKNAIARIATGNIKPGERSRALTKQVGEEHLGKEVGLAGNTIEDMKFNKEALTKTFENSSNFYTKYAAARQLANLGAGEKLGALLDTEANKGAGANTQNLAILSRAINDKYDLKNSHHQVFFRGAGIQKALSEGKSSAADLLATGNALASKKAMDDMGANMVVGQSQEGIRELGKTYDRLMQNPDAAHSMGGGKTNREVAEQIRQTMGEAMHTVASQERLIPNLTGARGEALVEVETKLGTRGQSGLDYSETLAATKAQVEARVNRAGGPGGGGGTGGGAQTPPQPQIILPGTPQFQATVANPTAPPAPGPGPAPSTPPPVVNPGPSYQPPTPASDTQRNRERGGNFGSNFRE